MFVGINTLFACFGIQDGSNYVTSSSSNGAVLKIIGCLNIESGIEQVFNSHSIQTYPNPFGNQITIENHVQSDIIKVSITDMLGREILNINPPSPAFS